MPANSLIYKSIWQGTINSFPTIRLAGGGVPSPRGGQEGPCIGPHSALPNPTSFTLRNQM